MDVLKACPECGRVTLQSYRFCPWCGGAFAMMEAEEDADVEVELGCGNEDDIVDAAEADSGEASGAFGLPPGEGALPEFDEGRQGPGAASAAGEIDAVRRGMALSDAAMSEAAFMDDVVDRLEEVNRAGEGPRMLEMKRRLEALERDLDDLIPDNRG